MAGGLPSIGKSVRNATVDPSNASDATKRLMSPNAKEDPDAVRSNNEQKEWLGGSGKPKPPFGPQGREF